MGELHHQEEIGEARERVPVDDAGTGGPLVVSVG